MRTYFFLTLLVTVLNQSARYPLHLALNGTYFCWDRSVTGESIDHENKDALLFWSEDGLVRRIDIRAERLFDRRALEAQQDPVVDQLLRLRDTYAQLATEAFGVLEQLRELLRSLHEEPLQAYPERLTGWELRRRSTEVHALAERFNDAQLEGARRMRGKYSVLKSTLT